MRAEGGSATPGGNAVHTPVLVEPVTRLVGECVRASRQQAVPRAGAAWLVDGTLGHAGHATALLDAVAELHVLGVDQDDEILALARARLASYGTRARAERARHSEIAALLAQLELEPLAFLFDLGASSLQLDRAERGFSFQVDGPLDMRMDRRRTRTAAEVLNTASEHELARLLREEGEEPQAERIARAIVAARRNTPHARTLPLADLVEHVLGGRRGRLHPATRVFQALRRVVNEEADELGAALACAENCLPDGGLLLVISFHSLEDGVVKRFLAGGEAEQRWSVLTRKPIEPDRAEERANPRSRSARLRAALRRRGPGGAR
ncbi:MAG: 16S rRNA (cytosine(1402)-N(4))-methyltransferase RsmH [Planctomycetota bacterium]|nr:MAG: 16S rRNA (cytosine(1402)-N(4))-methyltransferase RsmH [Planctomycetota bacterium]